MSPGPMSGASSHCGALEDPSLSMMESLAITFHVGKCPYEPAFDAHNCGGDRRRSFVTCASMSCSRRSAPRGPRCVMGPWPPNRPGLMVCGSTTIWLARCKGRHTCSSAGPYCPRSPNWCRAYYRAVGAERGQPGPRDPGGHGCDTATGEQWTPCFRARCGSTDRHDLGDRARGPRASGTR